MEKIALNGFKKEIQYYNSDNKPRFTNKLIIYRKSTFVNWSAYLLQKKFSFK